MRTTFTIENLDTPTGSLFIVTDSERRLRAIDWKDHEARMRRFLKLHYGDCALQPGAVEGSAARHALAAYFKGDLGALDDLPTATNGTDFQRQVWAMLRKIPVGQTISYGELAKWVGRPNAARAVGMANGSNPIPIVVPCHRVIGADASLTGFGGGLERKRWLLAHEAANIPLLLRSAMG